MEGKVIKKYDEKNLPKGLTNQDWNFMRHYFKHDANNPIGDVPEKIMIKIKPTIPKYVDTIITDEEYLSNKDKYTFNTPLSKESFWYRKIFEYYYPNKSNVIPHFWLPNWTNVKDPSARELCLNI